MDLILVVAALAALVGLDLAAARWGRDSRGDQESGRPARRTWW